MSSLVHAGSGINLQQLTFHFDQIIDEGYLREAWSLLTQHYEMLRASIHISNKERAFFKIWSNCGATIESNLYPDACTANREVTIKRHLAEDLAQEFDLTKAPLARITLISFGTAMSSMLFTYHHSILDGSSRRIVLQNLLNVYTSLQNGDSPVIDECANYEIFGDWVRHIDHEAHDQYWTTQNALKQAVGELPPNLDPAHNHEHLRIDSGVVRSWLSKSEIKLTVSEQAANQPRLPEIYISAWLILLAHYCDSSSVVMGITRAGRREPDVEVSDVIGSTIAAIPLAADLDKMTSVTDLLMYVRQFISSSRKCEHSDLARVAKLHGIPSDKPVFASDLVINRVRYDVFESLTKNGPKITQCEKIEHPDVPLFIQIYSPGDAEIELYFDKSRYSNDFAKQILNHYLNLIRALCVVDGTIDWRNISMLDEQERHYLLYELNRTDNTCEQQLSLRDVFEREAKTHGNRVALMHDDTTVTLGDLNQQSNRLAHYLIETGIGPETPVGILLPRTPDLLIAMLGVIKAGGALLPLDPDYPIERIRYMLEDSQAPVCLSTQDLQSRVGESSCRLVLMADIKNKTRDYSNLNPQTRISTNSMFSLIYTSGSTGQPKGVIGTNQGVLNRCQWMWQTYPFSQGEVCCLTTRISFVDSIWEIFGPLAQGIPLVLIADENVRDVDRLISTLATHKITRLVLVPSLLRAILAVTDRLSERLPELKFWVSSGEPLSEELYIRFRAAHPEATLLNLYGSTEISADATCFEMAPNSDPEKILIGRPINNTQVYILNCFQHPVPVGVPGEMYVGGQCIARGYHNQPETTAERFVVNPFTDFSAEKLFKTGDLARYDTDGRIEYLGRTDVQIKIRGFRIEPGEIENAIVGTNGVENAVVVVKGDSPERHYLAAYCVAETGNKIDSKLIRDTLRKQLPAHMIPVTYTAIDSFPETPSGKIDRARLSKEIPDQQPDNGYQQESQASSRDRNLAETTRRMVEIWEDITGARNVSLHSNFFDLGGHSLLAVELILRIESDFGLKLPIQTIYEHPNLIDFTAALRAERPDVSFFKLAPTRHDSKQRPLFLTNGLFLYRDLAIALGTDQPTYGVYLEEEVSNARAESDVQVSVPFSSVEQAASKYRRVIQEIQPEGPYRLGGESFGGLVAFEIAKQLAADDEIIELLALLDANAPGSLKHLRGWRWVNHCKGLWQHPVSYSRKLFSRKSLLKKLNPGHGANSDRSSGIDLYRCYQPGMFRGQVIVFRAQDNDWIGFDRPDDLGWREYVEGEVTVYEIPGDHLGILNFPNTNLLAEKLKLHLEK